MVTLLKEATAHRRVVSLLNSKVAMVVPLNSSMVAHLRKGIGAPLKDLRPGNSNGGLRKVNRDTAHLHKVNSLPNNNNLINMAEALRRNRVQATSQASRRKETQVEMQTHYAVP
jgi:hypothetical protein